MISLDVDTALTEVPVNLSPLKDVTDGVTIETGITYNDTGMSLTWNFVTTAGVMTSTAVTPTTAGVHDWNHQAGGMYTLEIPDTGGTVNNDAEGYGWFTGKCDATLPWTGPLCCFRAEGINDLLVDDTFSATRGLAGTALPAAAADAVGGLPISDAGGLDMDAILVDTNALNDTKIPDTLSLANINAEVDTSIETYGLQYFFLLSYNPASPFGNANAWANELVEDDGGVTRFTANALEQAGGAAIEAIIVMQNTTIATLASQTSFTLTAGSGDDDAYNDRLIVVTDSSTSTQKAVGRVSDYTGSTKTVTLSADPGIFTMAVGDTVDILSIGAIDVSLLATQLTTSLATLNDLSAAQVNAEVDTALTDYDPPTRAELTSDIATVTHPNLLQTGTITVTSQTVFVLSDGSVDDDAYNGHRIVIEDATTAEQKAVGQVEDYVGSTKTVTLKSDPGIFTMATGDKFKIFATADVSDLQTSFNNINAVANTPVGEVSGFPLEIIQGDAYTTDNGKEIKLYFKDAAGDTLTTFGSKSPADSDFTWSIRFTPDDTPEASATMEVTGDENDWDATDPQEPFLTIELPSASTDLLTVDDGYLTKDYVYQVILQWDPSDDHELTGVANATIPVRRKLSS